MNTHPKTLLAGFIAGALAALIFHQAVIFILNMTGATPNKPWSMVANAFGVPAIFNSMFWGGMWGVLFALIHHKFFPSLNFYVKGIVFGWLFPMFFGWFVLSYFRGQPIAGGFVPLRMLISMAILGSFGLGLAVLLPRVRKFLGA